MKASSRFMTLALTLVAVLIVSLLAATPALADDSAPPSESPPGEAAASTEGASSEAPPADEQAAEAPAAAEHAATVVTVPDPIWCPAGVAPNPLTPACTGSYSNLEDLVVAFQAGGEPDPTVNGVIWMAGLTFAGPDTSTGPVIISGGDGTLGTWENFALTINGGWSGLVGSTALNPNDPSRMLQSLDINGWLNNVTINHVQFIGALDATASLYIETTKNIVINNVDAESNPAGPGAMLDNNPGTGSLTIYDSTFSGNAGAGLITDSCGPIVARSLSAIDNTGLGAQLFNAGAPTPKPITLTGLNTFSLNDYGGLWLQSKGAITASNLTAHHNFLGYGVYISNTATGSVGNIILKGLNTFTANGWDGLRVWTLGSILASNLTANGNGTDAGRDPQSTGGEPDATGKGAFLSNFDSLVFKPITLTGTNTFNDNASAGLLINAWGPVIVNNLTANDNGCDLTKEEDYWCDGAGINAGSSILLTGYGRFSKNYDDGFVANAWNTGAVTLNNLYADKNGWWGAYAYTGSASGNVSLLGASVFLENGYSGLSIDAMGAVTLNNITANLNGQAMDPDGDGVYIDNTAALTPKPVKLNGTNVFQDNWDTGLEVFSYGAITTNNLTANGNDWGVYLNNCYDDGLGDCQGYSPQAVTLTGLNNISSNFTDGLDILSRGAIKVNSLAADFNGAYGAYLDNMWGNAVGGITQTGYLSTSVNGFIGLQVFSRGAISLANVAADRNGDEGVILENSYDPLVPANVTISGLNHFNDNWYGGLRIETYGAVLLNNVTANDNGDPLDASPEGRGLEISGWHGDASLVRPVTLNGVNTFIGNWDEGLIINTIGAVTLNKVTARSNGGDGLQVNNQYFISNQPVKVLGYAVANSNDDRGLSITSNGAITLNNVTTNFNSYQGTSLDNRSITLTPVSVTLLGTNTFNGTSNFEGLHVRSDGLITLWNVTANDNGGIGAYLNNTGYAIVGAARGITVLGNNSFTNNAVHGLQFFATGAVSLTRISADWNDGVGLGVDGAGVTGTAAGNITLTCGSTNWNDIYGIDLTSTAGTVTVKGLSYFGNDWWTSSPTIVSHTCPLP